MASCDYAPLGLLLAHVTGKVSVSIAQQETICDMRTPGYASDLFAPSLQFVSGKCGTG